MKSMSKQSDIGTILVPIDYSSYSTLACRYAAKIAQTSGDNICLLHSFYSPAYDLIELSGGLQTQHQLRAEVTEKLHETETKAIENYITTLYKYSELQAIEKTRVSYALEAGIAKEEIIAYADKILAKLVVMGTRGKDNKSKSILGSVTENAINRLKVPVITIPENYRFNNKENLKKIVYLTDFDESDFMSIKKLMQFSSLFNMKIHCAHIGNDDDKWAKLKMEGLKNYFQKVYDSENVECSILKNDSDLIQAVDQYVQTNKINIIALTHKKRSLIDKLFSPSFAKKLFYHAETPLMVFHG